MKKQKKANGMSEQTMEIAEKARKIKIPERNLTGFQTAVGKDKKQYYINNSKSTEGENRHRKTK